MSDPTFAAVSNLKTKATGLKKREQYASSLKVLDIALKKLKSMRDRTDLGLGDQKLLRMELADTHGMKGGVYRRLGEKKKALEMYEEGLKEEAKDHESTYNLVNTITLTIALGVSSPTDPEMVKRLRRAIESLKRETAGARSDEWWALSDLGQFNLLAGDGESAREAYDRAVRTAPAPDDLERHLTVLRELADKTKDASPEVAELIAATVAELARSQ